MKPILFNTEMVRAILEGRKTCTRRVVKKDKVDAVLSSPVRMENPDIPDDRFIKCLCTEPCEIGDILYVRETWNKVKLASESDWHYEYRASCENQAYFSNGFMAEWRPSIHMPKEAARLFLRVTAVWVERLREITCEQAYKEGCTNPIRFDELWNTTIKPADLPLYGWEANPWVWVIEFERCEKPEEGTR